MLAQRPMAEPRPTSPATHRLRARSGWIPGLCVATVLSACGDGGLGDAPVTRCFPEPSACTPAMFAGGLRAELGDPAAGAPVYAENCARCHGPDGHGLGEARHIDMRSAAWQASLRDAGLVATIRAGRGAKMPAFNLEDAALRDLLAHLRSLPGDGGAP